MSAIHFFFILLKSERLLFVYISNYIFIKTFSNTLPQLTNSVTFFLFYIQPLLSLYTFSICIITFSIIKFSLPFLLPCSFLLPPFGNPIQFQFPLISQNLEQLTQTTVNHRASPPRQVTPRTASHSTLAPISPSVV